MKVISPYIEILTPIDGAVILKHLEQCGRVCYKSEDKITDESCVKFIKGIIDRGHEAVLEHYNISVRIVCDRGVTHEIVRHRLASYCQESTRYCNYTKDKFGNEITVIEPCFFEKDSREYFIWKRSMERAEIAYFDLLDNGCTAQQARDVLPNSLKTEIVMTANIREWRHFLKLRCSSAAHPQMQQVAKMILDEFYRSMPTLFDDVREEVYG